MQPGTIIAIILLGGLFIAFIVWLHRNRTESYHRAQESIAKSIGGNYERGEWPLEGTISREMNGKLFQIELSQGEKMKGKMVFLKLKIPEVAFDGKLEIKKKGIFLRALQMTVPGDPLTTGNPEFDSRIVIKGEPVSKLMNFIMNIEFQKAVTALADRKFTIIGKDGILVAVKIYSEKPDRYVETLKNDIESMVIIADCFGK